VASEIARTQAAMTEGVERLLVHGDLKSLSVSERLAFYKSRCDAAGLNPVARPFIYLELGGKLVLYATKECGEQLNAMHGIQHKITSRSHDEKAGLYVVEVEALTRDGRSTMDIGVVVVSGLRGADMANAMMKAVTKAKRRATLSLCGLGDIVDETELDTVAGKRECLPSGERKAIDNGSGYASGQYDHPEQAAEWEKVLRERLQYHQQRWLDTYQDEQTGEFPPGFKQEVVRLHQLDNHLLKWAGDTGRLEGFPIPEQGQKAHQVCRITSIIDHRGKKDRKAIREEVERYILNEYKKAEERMEALQTGEAVDAEVEEASDGAG
jgi:hypothetical protein